MYGNLTPGQINSLSPMMQNYIKTREEYKDSILLYRLGDFYELFFDDAIIASRELELTLTGKSCGLEERAPMCGVPFHAVDIYIDKLIGKGYKVAICEQVEDPKAAKGLVKREVTRIVTPGTNISTTLLDESKNNYLMCVVFLTNGIGIAVSDVTTGSFLTTEVSSLTNLNDEIGKFCPTEIICNDAFMISSFNFDEIKYKYHTSISPIDSHFFDDNVCKKTILSHFKVNTLSSLGADVFPIGVIAAGSLLIYLNEIQKCELNHITTLTPYSTGKYMIIDSSTRRNLELTETMREKSRYGSLLWVLDKTKTAMGSRMLRSFIEQPLIDIKEITLRQSSVEKLCDNSMSRDEMREYLDAVYDLERLLSKVTYMSLNPRDLIAFKNSLEVLPGIKTVLKDYDDTLLNKMQDSIDALNDVYDMIDKAIIDEPPLSSKEGGFIKDGYNSEADRLRGAKIDGKKWLAELEQKEREQTGIKTLKIKYNKVFGYYFEVTNSFLNLVPDYFIRKQTLTGGERYTTDKLKELEDTILNAEDKLYALEYQLFCDIRKYISLQIPRIQQTASSIATLDALCSLSYVAEKNSYIKPALNEKGIINIKNGRHPVVEKVIDNNMFIPNDTYLDNKKHLINIITGPNMAGKSTYMRQSALIVLMAQIGSFVPASSADISVVDRIFTRVGASDDLSTGQSTFMVEMNEVSNILRNATSNSLIILDEIGRGTSTFDGLSIAWAVVEHIANTRILGAKTLFATHYHELTELEGKMDNVNNYCIAVKENGDDIVFLRKIIKGGADKSYGIQVAKLAGVPDMVIERAKEIVNELSQNDIMDKVEKIAVNSSSNLKDHKAVHADEVDVGQFSLFDTVKDEDILKELEELDISTMTPLDGLNTLYRLQGKIKNRY